MAESREAAATAELEALRGALVGGASPGGLALEGLTPGRASKARVAYLERLRGDIARLRADNLRLRASQGPLLLAPPPSRFAEALAAEATSTALVVKAPARNLGRETTSLREANRKLQDQVQRSRQALSVIAAVQSKHRQGKEATAAIAEGSGAAAAGVAVGEVAARSSGRAAVVVAAAAAVVDEVRGEVRAGEVRAGKAPGLTQLDKENAVNGVARGERGTPSRLGARLLAREEGTPIKRGLRAFASPVETPRRTARSAIGL